MKDLATSLDFIQTSFKQAVVSRKHPWHTVVLADTNAQARMLVLRDCADNSLWFHSHAKSAKVNYLKQHPQATVLAYCHVSNQQVRLSGNVRITAKDPKSEAKWQNLSLSARRCYLANQPGEVLAEPGPGYPAKFDQINNVDISESEYAKSHFVRLEFVYHKIDFLQLAATGHMRAVFELDDHTWQGNWVAP